MVDFFQRTTLPWMTFVLLKETVNLQMKESCVSSCGVILNLCLVDLRQNVELDANLVRTSPKSSLNTIIWITLFAVTKSRITDTKSTTTDVALPFFPPLIIVTRWVIRAEKTVMQRPS